MSRTPTAHMFVEIINYSVIIILRNIIITYNIIK